MKKLAIVGSHIATRSDAPYDDPDYEIWLFNEAPMADWCKRWDAILQLHNPEIYSSPTNWVNDGHWAWLQQDHGIGKTIYLQAQDERVPNSVRYPLDEICASLPGANNRWFMSSAAYALALALYLGYETIDIYGVELSSNTEYSYQLPNWLYWLGIAYGMGVKIGLYSGQVHFAERLYGFEGETQLPRDHFIKRVAGLEAGYKQAEWDLKKAKAALDDAMLNRKYSSILALITDMREVSIACGEISGAMAEADKYSHRDDPISRQEFERRAAQAERDGEGYSATMYHAGGKAEYVLNVWRDTGNFEALRQLRLFLQEQARAAYDLGAHLGISRENKDYMIEFDNRLTAAGGVRTLAAMNGVQP
jgi:hypothetical protein